MKKEIIEWLGAIVIAIVIIFIIRTFLFLSYTVDGVSMHPTFDDNDRVIVNKFIYDISDIDNGDIIVFNSPAGPAYVKRVIATEGDTVEMIDKEVFVNGEQIDQSYVTHTEDTYLDNFTLQDLGVNSDTIPEDHLLVLGDNRPVSRDSRDFGLIEESDVIGEVQLRYWPFNRSFIDFN